MLGHELSRSKNLFPAVMTALSLPYCSVSGISPITSCLHQLEMLLAFSFLKVIIGSRRAGKGGFGLKIPAELLVLKYLLYAWISSRIPFIA